MTAKATALQLDVDISNPGQFFACCGLLELADRLWKGAESWFDKLGTEFHLRPSKEAKNADDLLNSFAKCSLNNTMRAEDRARYEELGKLKTKDLTKAMEEERKRFDSMERDLPLVLGPPFSMQLDWYRDDYSGGSRFKTWAGMQSVFKIAKAMKEPLESGKFEDVANADWLGHTCGEAVSFNFDSDLGSQSSALDVGFSLDPLSMSSGTRPLLELAAFVGLQRFRPTRFGKANNHIYATWTLPACPKSACLAAAGLLSFPDSRLMAFPLLFRTKYLKSFLPAQPFVR